MSNLIATCWLPQGFAKYQGTMRLSCRMEAWLTRSYLIRLIYQWLVSSRQPPTNRPSLSSTALLTSILCLTTQSAHHWRPPIQTTATKPGRVTKTSPAIQHKSVTILQRSCTKLDTEKKVGTIKLASGTDQLVSYDYAICYSGLGRDHPTVPQSFEQE